MRQHARTGEVSDSGREGTQGCAGGSAPQSRLRFGGFLAAGHRGGRGGGEGGPAAR
jgi:hypothetical protein